MSEEANGTNANRTSGVKHSAVCDLNTFKSQDYDVIIIGGGTAGLAIAARLTEDPDLSVGVIEAGSDRRGDPLIDTPALFLGTFNKPEYDWQFKTVPQKSTRGIAQHMPRGKVLGGSSAINYMMYVRGSVQDYDNWADMVGDESWNAKNMMQYMRKHQTLEPFDESIVDRSTMPLVDGFHGTTGPVKTSFNDYLLPIEEDIIKACDEVTGITKKPVDPWSGDHIGFFNTLGSVVRTGPDRGKRSYAARGYLGAADDRPNLKILCDAFALINLDGQKATGVTFTHEGQQHSISVKREVIICGGAINSPQILELSGIGDPEVLHAAGIECKVNLPSVGNNFQDHTIVVAGYELAPGIMSLDAIYIPEVMANAQQVLLEKQAGPLTSISSCQGFFPYKKFATPEEVQETVQSIRKTAEESSPYQKKQLEQVIQHLEDEKSANIQFVLVAATGDFQEGPGDQSILFPPPKEPGTAMGVTLAVCLQYPVSRGSVHITSSDPSQQPAIEPAYLIHSADVAVAGAGLKFADSVAKAKALDGKFAKRIFPDEKINLQNTEENRKAASEWAIGEYHPCGSCAMGETVDSRLRVKGVQGLRVADASVFPNNVSGNICSTVYAIAEKAADMIKADYVDK
ncbi:hypothetical protein BP6252_07489 [Coleophoma cylindrospora]|uniref:Glucose-methanol-choline oxidoreductase N-terminal domain-containing protein n=1 Tax=Coleophoma cylindrospora TaxID=1849047 RepID=A0A3D8RHQ5_9HELO|nr:hypothetical protein BP6252_07489 [Coleophoma cylindrospora]